MVTGGKLHQRYQITRVLGSGAFGDTYLAQDLDLPNHPQCVVKHLQIKPPNTAAALPIARRLFKSEAEALQKLGTHDQIPQLFAYFEENNEFYLVQELVKGQDLTKEVYPKNQLPESQVKKLLREILEVLAVVHQQNIIHRDLKPQNIMRRSGDGKIMLIDFGAVKETMMVNPQGQTMLTVSIGTPGYMPIEQTAGSPKFASDIYAVGMLGIYALTGIQPHELPKDTTTEEVIWRNLANVSDDFAKILTKMVRYHFSARYQDAVKALQALTPATSLQPKRDRRHFLRVAGFSVGGFGLAVVSNQLISGCAKNSGSISTTSNNSNLKTFNFEVVKTNSRGSIIDRSNSSARYYEEDLGNGVILEMVEISGGTFMMGSPTSEAGRRDRESPQHRVTVPSFFMGRYQLTQAQYQAIIGNNPSSFKGGSTSLTNQRPVEKVSWNDAIKFCEQLSQKTGKTYRLPSEAEWEYACRAGTTTPFYFGESITPDLVNYRGNSTYADAPKGLYRKQTTDVGTFPPNAFGLYDMHGNVWEWCMDTWHENYINAPTDGSAWISQSDDGYNLRGGSWYDDPEGCRSACRSSNYRDERELIRNDVGFRVACVVG